MRTTLIVSFFTLILIAAIWQIDKVMAVALGAVIGASTAQSIIYLHNRLKRAPKSLKQEYREREEDLSLETYSNAYETARNYNI